MKVLFGIQATGNGHISRARQLVPELKKMGIEVDCLFSGRTKDKYFDMDVFGDYSTREGLTFSTRSGRIDVPKTIFKANFPKLSTDIQKLDVSKYDVILSDFEPVTAWAAKLHDKEVIGIGHQYAFRYPILQAKGSLVDQVVMENFAPSQKFCGLHYHHFGHPILPPIIRKEVYLKSIEEKDFVLVYLPFERRSAITNLLREVRDTKFEIYHPDCKKSYQIGNLSWNPPSSHNFTRALNECSRVFCNAGFMLTSEVIALGKPLLVRPLAAQPEQLSNAKAIEYLGLGSSIKELEANTVEAWINSQFAPQDIAFGDTAAAIASWIYDGCGESVYELSKRVWKEAAS